MSSSEAATAPEPRGLAATTSRRWDELLGGLADVTVLVVGEACLDAWYAGPSRRLSREAPVPVVDVEQEQRAPGGAANAAAGVAALGATVRFVSAVGDDEDAFALRAALTSAGVPTGDLVVAPGRRTAAKRRVLSEGQLLLRFDAGDTGALPPAAAAALVRRVEAACVGADVVLVADYEAGLFTPQTRLAVAAAARRAGARLVVDAHDPAAWAGTHPDLVTPAAEEVARLLGVTLAPGDRVAQVVAMAARLLAATAAHALAVTLDRDGAVLLSADASPHRVVADPLPVVTTVGAGDSFAAALACVLGAGGTTAEAADAGGAAASVVVRQPGTTVCGPAQLHARLVGASAPVLDVARLAGCVQTHRALGRRVVMTNGCFDGLHRGHLAHLSAARDCGDVLVVALNSDESARRLKGHNPVHPAADRAAVLAGLAAVDHVVVFDGDTPADLLRLARPDVYVKGGDWTEQMVREAPVVRSFGGEVRILDWVDDGVAVVR